MKGFIDSGFKAQRQPLSHFQSDYGLAADEDEAEQGFEEDEDEDAESGSFVSGDENDE